MLLPLLLAAFLGAPGAAAAEDPTASSSIVGGRDAAIEDWPSIAFLLAAWDLDDDGVLDEGASCTGTVVAPTWILSAAHCAFRPDGGPIDALLSVTGVADGNSPLGEAITADRIVVHPAWDPQRLIGDALLIHLRSPSARPAMPLARGGLAVHSDGTVPNAAGWGTVDEASTLEAAVLQEAHLQLRDEATCALVARDFDATTQACAGTQGLTGVCHGDSGGPLTVLDAAGAPHLWGLTSYGPQVEQQPPLAPCSRAVPAVFTWVPALAAWVRATAGLPTAPLPPPAPPAPPPTLPSPPPVPPVLAPAPDRVAPVLRRVRLSARRFAAATRGAAFARRRGTTLSFSLSEAAAVRIRIRRGRRTLSPTPMIAASAGRTERRFSGRLGGRRLLPGAYRLQVGAVDAAGNAARAVTVRFRITR